MLTERRFSSLFHAALALVLLLGAATGARSAELIMFKQTLCEWCEVWEEEIGNIYAKTDEGKRVPIRKVNIHGDRPADLSIIKRVVYTPTFVLIHNGTEIGRILGYPGEDHFWGLLNQLLERLPVESNGTI